MSKNTRNQQILQLTDLYVAYRDNKITLGELHDGVEAVLDSACREAREQALKDVKMQGYGHDNGTEFVLNITYADLDKLNQLGKG